MANFKYQRKVRFFPLFPFGYCSKDAMAISGRENEYATLTLLGDDPDEILAQCRQHHRNALDRARYLCTKKYATDTTRACGDPPIPRSFRHITKLGLAVLLEIPDEAATDDDESGNETSAINGKIKEDFFRSGSITSAELRDTLLNLASSDEPGDQQAFRETLLDAVIDGRLTPLTCAIDKAGKAKTYSSKFSPNQMLSVWRMSNIQAMFLANGHLTYLDRRPYDTGFAIDGITDEQSFNAYVDKHGLTIPALTFYALNKWYQNNPGFYRITQRTPDLSELAREEWIDAPAFYSTNELPNADKQVIITSNEKGTKKVINAIYVGLAAGANVNYVCYYAKPGEFKWIQKRERETQGELTDAVHQMKTLNPDLRYNNKVDFALMFCSTIRQFEEIFERTKTKHEKNKKLKYPTKEPYTDMFVIPVNDSGTFLLWLLLEYSPVETEQMIHRGLVDGAIGFEHQQNLYYPLTYNGKKVFSGYTMNINKIHHVLEDHLDGNDFYVCCFPEQVPWYQKLFPGKTFL